jgi:hypothetical protein
MVINNLIFQLQKVSLQAPAAAALAPVTVPGRPSLCNRPRRLSCCKERMKIHDQIIDSHINLHLLMNPCAWWSTSRLSLSCSARRRLSLAVANVVVASAIVVTAVAVADATRRQ